MINRSFVKKLFIKCNIKLFDQGGRVYDVCDEHKIKFGCGIK